LKNERTWIQEKKHRSGRIAQGDGQSSPEEGGSMKRFVFALALILFWTTQVFGQSSVITQQPQNQTAGVGQTARFTIAVRDPTCTVMWQRNGSNIRSGVDLVSYTTPPVKLADNGAKFGAAVYNCKTAANAHSSKAALTVATIAVAPTISVQPANQAGTVGQTATFSVVTSGTAPVSHQWQKNGANITGATSATYITPPTVASDNGATFRVVARNSAGSVMSNAAKLTVNAAAGAPTISVQPANQAVAAGQTATFTVVATGTAPLSYQWRKNGATITGATSASYTTPATTSGDSGATFDVVVSNSAGSATSNAATLTVTSGNSIATVTVVSLVPGVAVPPTFMGISVDMFDAQNSISGMGTPPNTNPVYRRLVQNLLFPGQGPFIFNIEEDSPSSSAPTAAQVSTFAQMYADTGALFWLPANMCHNSTSEAQAEASAYVANMPSAAFLGMVMGNEPDGACSTYPSTFSAYETMYTTWQTAINSVSGGPGIEFIAPNFGGQMPLVWGPPHADLNTFIDDKTLTLASASQHWYAGVGCGNTVPGDFLLTPAAATNLSSIIGLFTSNAHSKGLPTVISEMNSVDCGGQAGVSNTFQSALWLADASFNLVNAGVDGIRIFNDQGNYDMFQFAQSPWRVSSIRPEYYGALMFQEATQDGAHLLPITLSTSANITAWATLDKNGNVRVAVFNKDKTAQGDVIVAAVGLGNAVLKTLTAPSYTSTSGVRYGGQTFDGSSDGTIQGTLSTTTVTPSLGVYTFTIAHTSAALLTINP
jgi:hypothetical protein